MADAPAPHLLPPGGCSRSRYGIFTAFLMCNNGLAMCPYLGRIAANALSGRNYHIGGTFPVRAEPFSCKQNANN
jgi:hypothetical protein